MLGTLGRFPFAEPTSSASASLGGAKGSFISQKGLLAAGGPQRSSGQWQQRSSQGRLAIQTHAVVDVERGLAANRRPQQAPEHLHVVSAFPEGSGCLPEVLYRLLDPSAAVELPPPGTVTLRESDNRELDKLVAALGRNKSTWRRALALHEWLLQIGYRPDDRLCTTLIRVCAQHGQAAIALSLYDWMRGSQEEGGASLTPTVFTYTAAMRAALTGNMLDRAIKVWEDAVAAKCDIDCRLCTTLIEVCGRKGDTDRALEAYAQMRDAPKDSRMAPSVHAYTAAMRAAAEGGRWEAALSIWDDMQKAGCKPTGHAYAAVISACAAGGQWQKAVSLFDEMLAWGVRPDVVSCTALITALGTDGQWERAEKVVEWMLRSDIKPNVRTYGALITALGNARQWDRALDIVKRMRRHGFGGGLEPNAYTYSALLKTMGEQGKWQLAERFFSELESEQLEMMAREATAATAGDASSAAAGADVAPAGMPRSLSSAQLAELDSLQQHMAAASLSAQFNIGVEDAALLTTAAWLQTAAVAAATPAATAVSAFPGMSKQVLTDVSPSPAAAAAVGSNPEAIAAAAAAVAAMAAARQQQLVAAAAAGGDMAAAMDSSALLQLPLLQLQHQVLSAAPAASTEQEDEEGECLHRIASSAAEQVLATPRPSMDVSMDVATSAQSASAAPFFSYFSGFYSSNAAAAAGAGTAQERPASKQSEAAGLSFSRPSVQPGHLYDAAAAATAADAAASDSPSSVAGAAAAAALEGAAAASTAAASTAFGPSAAAPGSALVQQEGQAAWTNDNAAVRGLSLHLEELSTPLASLPPAAATTASTGGGATAVANNAVAVGAPDGLGPKIRPLPKGRGPVNEVVCGALMLAYERAGKWEEAVAVLERARRLGISPNTIMYNTAISALGKANQVDAAEALFDQMPSPDAVSYETMIAAYGMSGMDDKAEACFERMRVAGFAPRDYAFCGLIAAHSFKGNWRAALRVQERMVAAGVTPTVHIYNALIAACDRAHQYERAMAIARDMRAAGIQANQVTQSLLEGVCQQGMREVETQQAAAAALSAAVAAAGTLMIRAGIF